MDIYVGNLAFTATEEDLSGLLAPLGAVQSIKLINDRETGKFRGFAFVSMESREEALNAIADLNGKEFMGRELRVREAAERPQSSGGFRGGQGGGERRFSGGGQGGERRFNSGPGGGERRFSGGDRSPRPASGGGFRSERSERPAERSERGERSFDRGDRKPERGERSFDRGERGERGGFRGDRRPTYRREESDDDQY